MADLSGNGNEEVEGGRTAFLFRSGDWLAVTLARDGSNLPEADCGGPWVLDEEFELGVRHSVPGSINPEPVIRGVLRRGYHMWRADDHMRTTATTQ